MIPTLGVGGLFRSVTSFFGGTEADNESTESARLAEANKKLKGELRRAKKDLADRDASLQRLEMQTKVSWVESRTDFQ